MKTIQSKLLEVKDWLDQEALGPQIGSDYLSIADLLVSSIKDVKPTFLAQQLEGILNHKTTDPDELNEYDKAVQWYETLSPGNKELVEIYTELPQVYKDEDVECLFVKITEEKTNLYIIPYDKNYRVLREL